MEEERKKWESFYILCFVTGVAEMYVVAASTAKIHL